MSVVRRSRPKVISLFSGVGGLDYGFEAAGFETAAAVELDHDCCETLRATRRWPVIERSIFDIPTGEMLEAAGLKRGEADVLIGGPPCQPFSKGGYWSRGDSLRLNDPRANTLSAYLRVVDAAQPRTFLLENVQGLVYDRKDEGMQMLLAGINAINRRRKTSYRPFVAVLNAADFGVPQIRQRVFLVASRDGAHFSFPTPTHVPEDFRATTLFGQRPLETYRTAWDAIGDLSAEDDDDLEMRGRWAPLLPSIPEGQNYLWHTERGGGRPLFGWRRRFWTFLLKLAKAKPSWTIQAQPGPAVGPFHWNNRRLSVRELCRLQTFPDNLVVCGGRTSQQRQLGNAVPSLLAEVLAREIRSQLLQIRTTGKPKLLPPVRRPIPLPEPVKDVPKAFRSLEGFHPAHPGTGQGNAARNRALVAR